MRWNTSKCRETRASFTWSAGRFPGPAQATRFRHRKPTGADRFPILNTDLCSDLLPSRWPQYSGSHWHMSLLKSALTHYVGSLKGSTLRELNHAPKASLELEDRHPRPNGA